MEQEKGGINYQDKPHHEGQQNNTAPASNNVNTSHREMNDQDEIKEGTERDTANQAKPDDSRQGNSSI